MKYEWLKKNLLRSGFNVGVEGNSDEIYKEKIVCYLDILAWKEKIAKTVENKNEANKLYKIYQDFIKSFNNIEKNYPSLRINIISASIFLSWDLNYYENSMKIMNILKCQIQQLAMNDLLIRGGIFKGKLFHDNDMIFGPALCEAYRLENKCAVYPRIIFCEDIKKEYFADSQGDNNDPMGDYRKTVKKDLDGFYYIDYLAFHVNTSIEGEIKQDIFYKHLRDLIVNNIEDYKDHPEVKMKYEWLKENFNKAIEFYVEDESMKENLRITE